MIMKDLLLTLDDENIYDIEFDNDGDFLLTSGLETAILMSLLCEKRADASEITDPKWRRGDWSNELNDVEDYEIGSKIWLLGSGRNTQETLNNGIEAIQDGLQWLIDDNIIKAVTVTGTVGIRKIIYEIKITKPNNEIETYLFSDFKLTKENA